ncbi:zinc metalloproteinase dpy-31 [Lingula anatina]|uniref:Metalloendopeptidase n=1 Tax=Lingula anatina TaxID=7574 RepID=A0A2R2MT05_LINAN|nr:zinc metalloproteinase dpy-31 [Lingula anatina]XP_023933374.1 zinc metalloproteinase dpy-31 [Lingula anatina]|eukprot:XP_023933373.1 zinc metalloproteinase dpy-31 [Lingula anatina]
MPRCLNTYVLGDFIYTLNKAREQLNECQNTEKDGRKKRRRRKRHIIDFKEQDKRLWPQPIPYAFSTRFTDEDSRDIVRMAMWEWEYYTCVRFEEVADQKEFPTTTLAITRPRDDGLCGSHTGRVPYFKGNRQEIFLGKFCIAPPIVVHELGHVLGLLHVHTRPDRDNYIKVIWSNLGPKTLPQFDKMSADKSTTLGFPYDVNSVMHYGPRIFSKSWDAITMKTKDPLLQNSMGYPSRKNIQFFDAKAINNFYCKGWCYWTVYKPPCEHDGYQDPYDCYTCVCPDGLTGALCDTVIPSEGEHLCGGVVYASASKRTIETPNYGRGSYSPLQTCTWLIKASEGKRVAFTFTGARFGLQCYKKPLLQCVDSVEIRYGSSIAVTGARFCCDVLPRVTVISETHEILVLFRADYDITPNGYDSEVRSRTGFRIAFWEVAGADRRTIKSKY